MVTGGGVICILWGGGGDGVRETEKEERGISFSICPSCCFLSLFLSYPEFQSAINHVKIASHALAEI